MLESPTRPELFAEDRARGMLDVKFALRRKGRITPAILLDEARKIEDAIRQGHVVPFEFKDRHPFKHG